jgi:hypothetical protein
MFDEHQHVQPLEQDAFHMQEVNRDDPGRLDVQETAARSDPRGAAPSRCPQPAARRIS